jgi:hypothetical protein
LSILLRWLSNLSLLVKVIKSLLITANNQGQGLNQELIYTGLTRAMTYSMLFGGGKVLSLGQQCVEGSGLVERLLGGG